MNTFGHNFRVSLFGESHGACIGAVIDGVPAGIELSAGDFTVDLSRRKSGARGTTPRIEADVPEIVSGLYSGYTTGAPLSIVFRNTDTKPGDYSMFRDIPRPGHADFVAGVRWHGFNDPRGGGHFSGRLTLALVAAGTVARKVTGVDVSAFLSEVGGVPLASVQSIRPGEKDPSVLWSDVIGEAMAEGDSLGGVVDCCAGNVPAGLGEPFFDSVESLIAHAVFSIPGVRGIEFGDGFKASSMRGSMHNDPIVSSDGHCLRNGAGGVNGGLSNGNPIAFRVAFKPTSSIRKAQETFDMAHGCMSMLEIPGRHDVCFALRTPVIVESVTQMVLADLMLAR